MTSMTIDTNQFSGDAWIADERNEFRGNLPADGDTDANPETQDTARLRQSEATLGDIYDDLQDKLALARTRALMGERAEALGILQGATLEYTRYREALAAFPGRHALEHALHETAAALCVERAGEEAFVAQSAVLREEQTRQEVKTRPRARRAA